MGWDEVTIYMIRIGKLLLGRAAGTIPQNCLADQDDEPAHGGSTAAWKKFPGGSRECGISREMAEASSVTRAG
jgi:hypothetical protein